MLRLLHHAAELLPLKERRHVAREHPAGFIFLLTGPEKIRELMKLHDRFSVSGLRVSERHVDDERDLLPQMVKGDDLVKEHEIDVLEGLAVLHGASHGRLTVAEIIIGKISDQSARKGWEIIKSRAPEVGEDLSEITGRILRLYSEAADLHFPVYACDIELRIVSEEGIAAEGLIGLGGFQEIAVRRDIFQDSQHFDRGRKVREDLAAYRQDSVLSGPGEFGDGLQGREYIHEGTSG